MSVVLLVQQCVMSVICCFCFSLGAGASQTMTSNAGHVNKHIQQVASKYCIDSRKHFEDLSRIMQVRKLIFLLFKRLRLVKKYSEL